MPPLWLRFRLQLAVRGLDTLSKGSHLEASGGCRGLAHGSIGVDSRTARVTPWRTPQKEWHCASLANGPIMRLPRLSLAAALLSRLRLLNEIGGSLLAA